LEDFKRALARIQSDYGFYINCQTNPALALGGYDFSPDERLALTDPGKLADVLKHGIGLLRLRITISGTHDWVNRAALNATMENADENAKIVTEVQMIKQASTNEERTEAVVRLMGLIG
jgi:hypothetical protein